MHLIHFCMYQCCELQYVYIYFIYIYAYIHYALYCTNPLLKSVCWVLHTFNKNMHACMLRFFFLVWYA